MEEVVGEVLLDHVAPVPAADHEVVDPVRRVQLHDVPEDRPAADLDHRLGAGAGLLADASAQAAGEDDRLHGSHRAVRIRPGAPAPRRRAAGDAQPAED